MQHDSDGDGKVTREEAPEFMQSFFDRIDTNGDGAVDAAELEARRSQRGAGGGGGGERGAGGGGGGERGAGGGPGASGGGPPDLMQSDANGDGRVTKEEAPEYMQRFFDRADANGDGAIDQAEIDEMRSRFRGGGG